MCIRDSPENAKKVKFYIGDVRNPQSIRDAMPGVDYIFHACLLYTSLPAHHAQHIRQSPRRQLGCFYGYGYRVPGNIFINHPFIYYFVFTH